jgi:hypothetical protein
MFSLDFVTTKICLVTSTGFLEQAGMIDKKTSARRQD